MPGREPLRARLGLGRPELVAWALYDWANSAFVTTVVTAVFPIYYASVVAADMPRAVATARFAAVSSIALLTSAVVSPPLGALADQLPLKKRMLGATVALGALATAVLALTGRGDVRLAEVAFGVANVALMAGFVFYDALLAHVAAPDEIDRVSAAGYALGYLGGGLLLGLNLAAIQRPGWFGLADAAAASRASFVSVAIWWAVFSLPLLRTVREPPIETGVGKPLPIAASASIGSAMRAVATRLGRVRTTFARHRQAGLLLAAYFLYNDGIGTVYRMAAIYGAEIGLDSGALVGALLATQIASVPFAFGFGALARRTGPKRAVLGALVVYLLIVLAAWRMRTSWHFLGLALAVALVQGGAQSLTRSMFASMIPKSRSAELFGFFGVLDKVSGVLGPAAFAAVAAWTGSSRPAILVVAVFFVAGGAVLARVDVEAGRREAASADAANGEAS